MDQKIWLNKVFILFLCFIALHGSCMAMKRPTYMSEPCWLSYTNTWVTSRRSVIPEVDVHERMAHRIILAAKKDISDLGYSNVASFALSVTYSDRRVATLQLPFIVSSCEVTATEDSSAYYWQQHGPYTPVISVSSFFQSSPSYSFSTRDATASFITRIMRAQEEKLYGAENWQLGSALGLLDERVRSGSHLSHLIRPAGTESGSDNEILRSVLHCEQVVFDRMMIDDIFIDLFLRQLEKSDNPIVEIGFHIDTYNDICPKCFSTCKHRKNHLLKRIVSGLTRHGHTAKIAENAFKILISSHREYKIPENEYITGRDISDSCCREDLIFQFRNEGAKSALEKITNVEKLRAAKCAEIDDLFQQIKTASSIDAKSKLDVEEKRFMDMVKTVEIAVSKRAIKPLPPANSTNAQLIALITEENRQLGELKRFVGDALGLIKEKISELSELHYFLEM